MIDVVAFRKKWLMPLIFFECYLTLTVLLFFYGPWPWEVDDPQMLAAYLLTAQVFIAIGYLMSWCRICRINCTEDMQVRHLVTGITFLRKALLVSILLLLPTSLSRTGSLFPNLISSLGDVGLAYNQNQERLGEGNIYVLVEYLRMLFAPWLIAVFPLVAVYWSLLSTRIRVLCAIVILFNLSMYMAIGTNKGIADSIITLPWLILLGVSSGILKLSFRRRTLAIIFVILAISFFLFFGMTQTQRSGGVGELGVFNSGFGLIEADRTNAISILLSDNSRIIYESLSRYLCQGYYALSLTFNIEYNSTLGLGHSMFFARNADSLFDTVYFTSDSLPGLLENQTGYGMIALWHSIYPWIASDVGFIGALFVMGALAYLLGISWGYSLKTLAPLWIVLFYLLLILFFYIPANNQIFQSGETSFAFILLLLGLVWSTFSRS
jgi:hypothetical protein